jgi:hypothetical protein
MTPDASEEVKEDGVRVPVVMFDVDGVFCPFGPDIPEYYDKGNAVDHLSSMHGQLVLDLVAMGAEVVWLTTWEADGLRWIESQLGLPELRRVEWEKVRSKGAAAARTAEGRGGAWVDDEIRRGAHEWASHQRLPFKLMKPDRNLGMTEGEADTLRDFVERSVQYARADAGYAAARAFTKGSSAVLRLRMHPYD